MITILEEVPIAVGAGAIYPYSEELMEKLHRETKYDESYSLGRVIQAGTNSKILVPRNMAPEGGEDLRRDGSPWKFKSKFKPRNKEQERIISESVALLKAGESFLISAPTGVGKTFMSMDIIAKVGVKTLVVVTKEDIEDQWAYAANQLLGLGTLNKDNTVSYGKGLGLVKADRCVVLGQGLVIAYIQSISKEDRYPASTFRNFGLVIWDECHRVGADFFSQSAYRVPAKLRFGLSATTERSDGKSEVLEAHIGPVKVVSTQVSQVAKVIRVRSPWSIPLVPIKVKRKNGITGVMETRTIVGPIPHNPGKHGHITKMLANCHARNIKICKFVKAAYDKERCILVQSDLRDHLDTMMAILVKMGIKQGDMTLYVGGMTKKEREEAKKKRVFLATYQMTREATDIPKLDTLVMATPKSDVVQIVGRILRDVEKKEPIVWDMVDATSKVFMGYANKRKKWYESQEFEIIMPPTAS